MRFTSCTRQYEERLTERQGSGSGQVYLGPPDFKSFSTDRSRRTDKPVTEHQRQLTAVTNSPPAQHLRWTWRRLLSAPWLQCVRLHWLMHPCCFFRHNHCDTQLWARAVHLLQCQCLGQLSLAPSVGQSYG